MLKAARICHAWKRLFSPKPENSFVSEYFILSMRDRHLIYSQSYCINRSLLCLFVYHSKPSNLPKRVGARRTNYPCPKKRRRNSMSISTAKASVRFSWCCSDMIGRDIVHLPFTTMAPDVNEGASFLTGNLPGHAIPIILRLFLEDKHYSPRSCSQTSSYDFSDMSNAVLSRPFEPEMSST